MLTDYNGKRIQVVGSAKVTVKYEEQVVEDLVVTIVKNNSVPLFGLTWLDRICLDWKKMFISNVKAKRTIQGVLSQFNSIFTEEIGTVKNAKATLILKLDAKPKFFPPRQIPCVLRAAVDREIRRQEAEGLWEKVTY